MLIRPFKEIPIKAKQNCDNLCSNLLTVLKTNSPEKEKKTNHLQTWSVSVKENEILKGCLLSNKNNLFIFVVFHLIRNLCLMCLFMSALTMAGAFTVPTAPPTPGYDGSGVKTTPYEGPSVQTTLPPGAEIVTVTNLYPTSKPLKKILS